ncbi:chorismate mutase [Segniliparus rotundus DSM 44985]|uniref:chorismate mutase n=2 Tax=Segniliparus rotundus TaxID=286802 RepID=D6ZBZ9_SEGRD|nr:chorismate mutase [Segniliparus rotundus DSM 44985]
MTMGALSKTVAAFLVAGAFACGPVPAAMANGVAAELVVQAAADRLAVSSDVAASKWFSGGAIHDQARADDVLEDAAEQGSAAGLDQDRVRALFEDQIAAAEGEEYARFAEWSFDPRSAPQAPTDLSSARARINEASSRLIQAYAQFAQKTAAKPACGAQVRAALAAEVSRRGWGAQWARGMRRAATHFCTG